MSRVEKGGYFGELALITHKPRAASAYVITPEVKLACKYSVHWSSCHSPVVSYSSLSNIFNKSSVLDVLAFERLLGPCQGVMKRNFDHYEDQLVKLFGSKSNVADLR